MTDAPPGPPPGPRDPADGWVELPDGRRYWGRAGAAGLLVTEPSGAVLLQHRVAWSHFGGTWGLPGGARHLGESALHGALREAQEETGIDTDRLAPRFAVRLDLGPWSYTTVAATAPERLAVAVSDRESTALEWVPAARVGELPLHPGLAAAWPRLTALAAQPEGVVVVDAANVVGSRPDGWWRDRPAAASRLLERLAVLAEAGVPVSWDDGEELPVVIRWPRYVVVLEGAARAASDRPGVDVVRAPGSGDDTIVDTVRRYVDAGAAVRVSTADRELADRIRAVGGAPEGPSRLLALLDQAADAQTPPSATAVPSTTAGSRGQDT